ncbi:MAG: PEP-CTERM sorting domain-containing protein [Pirellulales bacterium]
MTRSYLGWIVCALIGLTSARLDAAIIGVNISTGRTGETYALLPTDVAGVVPQANFNNIAAFSTATPLLTSAGVASGLSATVTGANFYSTFGAPQANPNNQLLNSYADSSGGTNSVVTVTGLPATGTYDVYAYVTSDGGNRNGVVAITGSATQYFFNTFGSGVANPGFVQATATTVGAAVPSNYVLFSGVSGTSFTLTASQIGVTGGGNAGFSGFQIVTPNAVPEPSTFAALGILSVLAGVVTLRRRHIV